MAGKNILICSKCAQELDLGGKTTSISVVCPNCGKKMIVPSAMRKKSKTGLIVLLLLFGLALGGGGFLVKRQMDTKAAARKAALEHQKLRDEENAKALRETQVLAEKKAAAWKYVLKFISKSTLKSETDFERARSALSKFQEEIATADDSDLIKQQESSLRGFEENAVENVLSNLKRKAVELAKKDDFAAAAELLKGYSGDFTTKTRGKRFAAALKLQRRAAEMERERRVKAERERKKKTAIDFQLRQTAKFVLREQFKRALNSFNDSAFADDLPEVGSLLKGLKELRGKIDCVFNDDSDRKFVLKLKNGRKVKVIVLGVGKGKVKVRYGKKVKSISLSSFDVVRLLRSFSPGDDKASDLFIGIQFAAAGMFDKAKERFEKTGKLAPHLIEQMDKIREMNEELAKAAPEKKEKDGGDSSGEKRTKVMPKDKESANLTLDFDFDDKLLKTSTYSYALAVERLMLYYGVSVNARYVELVDGLQNVGIVNFGTVDNRMEKFLDFSKHEGRQANLKIRKIFDMGDSKFRGLVRRYNSVAKTSGAGIINLRGQNTHWYCSGIRKEFLKMNKVTRAKARVKSCKAKFEKPVKAWITRKTPVCWTAAFGNEDDPKSGLFLIIGYDDETGEIIYLNEELSKKNRMKYKDAWSCTTGLYIIQPRVSKRTGK